MIWFEAIEHGDANKILINGDAILSVEYNKETNLTIINYIRSAYSATYIGGDVTAEIKKALSTKEKCVVHRIGG